MKITHHENRADFWTGGERTRPDGFPVGFGYVYFNDGSRVGWSDDQGAWYCQTAWGFPTSKHIWMAIAYLEELKLIKPIEEPAPADA